MSLTNTLRVLCLNCNSRVAINCTKNIYKTTFSQTGQSLAPFVASTLSLTAKNFRSSYLCSRCLNLFGRLEEASRKVKSIKCEIHKVFQDSYSSDIKSCPAKIQTAVKDTLVNCNNTQVPSAKPRVVITQCILNKSTNFKTFVQQKKVTYNAGLSNNFEKKNTHVVQLSNNRIGAKWVNLKTHQESLKNTNPHAEAVANIISLDDDDDVLPSLKDHQYTQLPTIAKKVSTCGAKEPIPSTKVLSIVQQKIVPKKKKKVLEPKKLEQSYTCSKCGIQKDTMKDLKLHSKIHAELYPFMCEKCGKVYKSKKALTIHLNTHERIGQYICTACDKCFTQKGALKRHLPIHTGEKPYECKICLKKFVHHSSFSMHMLVHTQEKKHKCDLCPYAFMSRSHLKRHMRTHGGEKRHSCEICGKSFYERYNVVAHMKTHDSEASRLKEKKLKQNRAIQRRCERCKIDFASAGEYNVHIRKHTPENMPSSENEYINGIQLFESNIDSASTS